MNTIRTANGYSIILWLISKSHPAIRNERAAESVKWIQVVRQCDGVLVFSFFLASELALVMSR